MSKSELTALDEKIADLESRLEHVKGRQCEVYARIVGYYRPVRNWNAGKRQEYSERVLFTET